LAFAFIFVQVPPALFAASAGTLINPNIKTLVVATAKSRFIMG
jgi:hypothetical protein